MEDDLTVHEAIDFKVVDNMMQLQRAQQISDSIILTMTIRRNAKLEKLQKIRILEIHFIYVYQIHKTKQNILVCIIDSYGAMEQLQLTVLTSRLKGKEWGMRVS